MWWIIVTLEIKIYLNLLPSIFKYLFFFNLTCNLPKTLIRIPPSNIGWESTAVMIRFIFWNVKLYKTEKKQIIVEQISFKKFIYFVFTCNFSKIFTAPCIWSPSNVINDWSFYKKKDKMLVIWFPFSGTAFTWPEGGVSSY